MVPITSGWPVRLISTIWRPAPMALGFPVHR
jgi:hypothetical protein